MAEAKQETKNFLIWIQKNLYSFQFNGGGGGGCEYMSLNIKQKQKYHL